MKAALITEEQIKAIDDALNNARTFIRNGVALGFIRMPDLDCPDPAHNTPKHIQQALDIVKSLKVQEPFSYYKTQKNTGEGAHESTSWYSPLPHKDNCDTTVPLYAGEQP